MICQSAGQAGQDTLNTLKDIYLTYRTERQPDQLSEDMLAAVVPGVTGDCPKNDFLDAAWRSLKALGNKHVGPNIGLVHMNKSELLQQVYTRGTWNRTPDHHVVFTYHIPGCSKAGWGSQAHAVFDGRVQSRGHGLQSVASACQRNQYHVKDKCPSARHYFRQ